MPPLAAGPPELEAAQVVVKSRGNDPSIFPLLVRALGFTPPGHNAAFPVSALLPQVVIGHRLWREGDVRNSERYVTLERVKFFHDVAQGPGQAWLQLEVKRGDLTRFDISQKRLMEQGQLTGLFHRVNAAQNDELAFVRLTHAERVLAVDAG